MAKSKKQAEALQNKNLDELLSIVNNLEKDVQASVTSAISKEITEKDKKAIIAKIEKKAIETDKEVKSWLTKTLPETYVTGAQSTDKAIKKYRIPIHQALTIEALRSAPENASHLTAVNAMLSDAYLDFGYGINGMVKGTRHILNDTVRRQMQTKIALGRLEGASIREIQKQITTVLENRNMTVLVARNGRKWSLKNYSTMLARTHAIRANTEASINRQLEFDIDITEVSDHSTITPLCQQYEGKIYSLTGKSKNYPMLPATPPFHPNCLHTLLPRPDLSARPDLE